ncbi:MAG TPA: hypothetical protein PLD12_11140, partial [Bacteroidales bacterium]|nr:hypothetical protein [Bacteroidales bacterium]
PALVKTEYGRQGKPNRWPWHLLWPLLYGIAVAFHSRLSSCQRFETTSAPAAILAVLTIHCSTPPRICATHRKKHR